jgi:hypothetical protein
MSPRARMVSAASSTCIPRGKGRPSLPLPLPLPLSSPSRVSLTIFVSLAAAAAAATFVPFPRLLDDLRLAHARVRKELVALRVAHLLRVWGLG